MYTDITSYSRNDKNRTPKVLEHNANGIKFTVHKHIAYGDEWLFSCTELHIDKRELNTTDMEDAKEKGINMMIESLTQTIDKYQKAIDSMKGNYDE